MIKAIFLLAAALGAVPAMAQTITFTIYADGSGTLGGTPFTDQVITFTQVTDTSAIVNPCFTYAYPCAPKVAGNTVTIGAMAPLTITDGTYFFANHTDLIGIANMPYYAFLAVNGSGSINTYNMQTSFGPTTFPIFSNAGDMSTSGGALSITSWSGDATFQAVLGTQTPEPASFFLMGSGLLAMGGILRRRIFGR